MRKIHRIFDCLILVLILLATLSSCGSGISSSDQTKELLDDLRSRIYETAPITDETVYWVKGGSVFHLYRDCKFLAKSEDVRYGTAYYSGRAKMCETCAKRAADESGKMTQIGTGTEAADYETDSLETETDPIVLEYDKNVTDTGSGDQRTDRDPSYDTETPDTVERMIHDDGEPIIDHNDNGNNQTVYWTPGGSVWHSDPDCSALARSNDVRSGTVAQSGKSRGCKRCSPQD